MIQILDRLKCVKHFVLAKMLLCVFMCSFLPLLEFAASEPVPGFNDGTLQLAFADLRQVCSISSFSYQ